MIRYRYLFAALLLAAVLGLVGLFRLDIDSDVLHLLPADNPVIGDSLDILEHHPIHSQIAVDITAAGADADFLVEIAEEVQRRMEASGLFAETGTQATVERFAAVAFHAAHTLPLLFSAEDLEKQVEPLLAEEHVYKRLEAIFATLSTMGALGQTSFIGLDPLGLKDRVLARMAPLAPSLSTGLHRGHLISADGRHLLLTARPLASGTDSTAARNITRLFAQISAEIGATHPGVVITPVGSYRAALDNERIIRADVRLALSLATAGIGLLLLLAFPRPLVGLLSLLPALAGTCLALFCYSLFHQSLSIMVLGFGGAIISITVDHGIAYMLFIDRPQTTTGSQASAEVRAIGLMAVLTSIGAFLILSASGFPIFTQLGQFTAMGIFFSYTFVHSVFPKLFTSMPAGSARPLPLHHLVDALYSTGRYGLWAALLAGAALLFFARPQFHTTLSSMNTMSEDTLAADALFREVWGDVSDRVVIMHSGDSTAELQHSNDRLLALIEADVEQGRINETFVPSMLFPGRQRAASNLTAWQHFWNRERQEHVQTTLRSAGDRLGFRPDAFTDFLALVDAGPDWQPRPIPEQFHDLLAITAGDQGYSQFISLVPGSGYSAEDFYARYGDIGKVFDPSLFADRLAELLFETFAVMLAVIAASVALLLFFFYLDLKLTLLTLLPPFFAYICTLGTLSLIGHPLDIPALMLSIVIFGMGVDYSIFCVRAHQRYRRLADPAYGLVRVAIFMAGTSTLIGFGVLCLAEHSMLRSIGITSILGIGYSLLGTFLLLPPLLKGYFAEYGTRGGSGSPASRIRSRFSRLEAYPRMFARLKLRFDPLFAELSAIIPAERRVDAIIDVGCGYGVPACWFLERYDSARVYGIDPDPERVRIASLATGTRGSMVHGQAPEIGATPPPADIVLLLDMLHYLDDETLMVLLRNCRRALAQGGIIVCRFVIRPSSRPSWSWRLEDFQVRRQGLQPFYRSPESMAAFFTRAGCENVRSLPAENNPELFWITAGTNTHEHD